MNYYGEYISDLNRYAEFNKRRKVARLGYIILSAGFFVGLFFLLRVL